MDTVLVTGGAGFLGSLLVKRLLYNGLDVVSIDLEGDELAHPHFVPIKGDVRDSSLMERVFSRYRFDAVFHLAAILAHAVKDKGFLWGSNVDGVRSVAGFAKRHGVPKVVFTSSNCLWGRSLGRPVTEDEPPNPIEIYGMSKWKGEEILSSYEDFFDVVTIRCPTIIDCGRLGLLAILFEFIDEGRKVWLVGGGRNRYQFIYAQDLIDALIAAAGHPGSDLFNIGSDNVKTLREIYAHVIAKAGTGARVASIPRGIAIPLMKLAHALKLSPLGPYQYKMIAEDFLFDTSKIKSTLAWRPTLTNEEMLYKAYRYYHENLDDIRSRKGVSAHRQPAKMGAIRLLKWIS